MKGDIEKPVESRPSLPAGFMMRIAQSSKGLYMVLILLLCITVWLMVNTESLLTDKLTSSRKKHVGHAESMSQSQLSKLSDESLHVPKQDSSEYTGNSDLDAHALLPMDLETDENLEAMLAKMLRVEDLPSPNSWSSGRHLIVSYYEGSYQANRIQELRDILWTNLANEHLTAVHVILDSIDMENDYIQNVSQTFQHKLILVRMNPGVSQPTYACLFGYANRVLSRGSIGMISNSDIIIGNSIKCTREVTPASSVVYNQTERRLVLALSRHPAPCGARKGEYDECFGYRGSHDTFIFAPPLSPSMISRLDFVQNRLGAENRLLAEMRDKAGYRVANPCGTIKVTHLHCAKNSRHIPLKRIARSGDGLYASINPSKVFKCGDKIY